MKRIICVTICLVMFVSGCAGRDAHIVKMHQSGDRDLSCRALESEIVGNRFLINQKMAHDRNKLWSNIWWFIWFPPLMDVKEAEKTEAEALQRRNNYLETLAIDKNCE